jgi:hypothetical protein
MSRLLPFAICWLVSSLCYGADGSPSPHQITMSVDADLIEFVKIAIWLGGGFLIVYALIGVAFFGWDVRKAQASLLDAQKGAKDAQMEVKNLLKDLREDYAALKDLKERFEEVGAKVQELSEARSPAGAVTHETRGALVGPGAVLAGVADVESVAFGAGLTDSEHVSPQPMSAQSRSNIDLIRNVIASSHFEWTTMGRIMDMTGLSSDDIVQAARDAGDIVITRSRQTDDFLFKFDKADQRSAVLRDPDWLRDPARKAREEARKAIDELIAQRQRGPDSQSK